ncbi:MAG: glutamate synthase (NADPH), homotetrameric [Nitrospirae bacterium CG_4_9_14_3_um_filter_53_35]|nr:MAG: glutamate synthase (NADPH), homotetrameric [Nitrospirae bacterium CG08_land_8_20_14_0_20_52_24]PIV84580.1 MAG: glutamate synthase (NADPH), homotetrameric [Nitrospirae bacterium CG17_big_fil_post_rev_8_21_14_2_50_50_9]PIW85968.1 MAG: glutamate synthase (NADPH), homotetrameric [Nitrospirae bacterium CG_4_8_14_3_um_filter_50_41]PIX86032.1 MAG: glutamate synthase (NADPH), homotetrameric [Nitrospirae bacterium CG_4_10_14_3_um_filter_53_41]PJA75352.1 MAG: glutamate synthase (NADPH), homotetra
MSDEKPTKGRQETKPKKPKIPRQPMPEQDPHQRAKNFSSVTLGYKLEHAVTEASRCLQCKKPFCITGCPVSINIPKFIKLIQEKEFLKAVQAIKETNLLPAVCGRVCPQEDQCEKVCVVGKKGEPVAIGRLERFVADYEAEHGEVPLPELPPKTGKKVAVVGAGPGGLTVAGDLIRRGHDVTIFEALHKAGGVLVYGIPEFRLPKAIVGREVKYLQRLGVDLRLNHVIGKIRTIDQLMKEDGYDAVFIGSGAGLPWFMGIPGENLNGVYSANEYLTRNNLMKAFEFPVYDTPIKKFKNVAVIGGGNVAMDSVRTALRLGADNAYIVYRRSRTEMPARKEEVDHAEHEGVQFKNLTAPVRVIGNEQGWVTGLECLKMELGEPDASGRRRPVPIKGSEFTLPMDAVIIAIGTSANPLIAQTTPDLKLNKKGYIEVENETTCRTSKKGVFAGGDIVTGSATVILAMGAGRNAAKAIQQYLQTGEWWKPNGNQ